MPRLSANLHGDLPQFSAAPVLCEPTALGTVGSDQGAELDENIRDILRSGVDFCHGESNFEELFMTNDWGEYSTSKNFREVYFAEKRTTLEEGPFCKDWIQESGVVLKHLNEVCSIWS